MIYFTADEHYGHERVLDFCKTTRKFSSIEEHDEYLIDANNRIVNDDDEVYHLGDFSFSRDRFKLAKLFGSLKGRHHLIYGNHDKKEVRSLPWASQQDYLTLKYNNKNFILFHYPIVYGQWNGAHHSSILLFGHVHGKPQYDAPAKAMDVGVDCTDLKPISIEQVIDKLSHIPKTIPRGFSGDSNNQS